MSPSASAKPVKILKKNLTSQDFGIRDCHYQGQSMLATAAYLEMALAASRMISGDRSLNHISFFQWEKPIILAESGTQLQLVLSDNGSQIQFCTVEKMRKWVHASGNLQKGASASNPRLPATPSSDDEGAPLSTLELYTQFRNAGFDYGHQFQAIQQLHQDDNRTSAKLVLPLELTDSFQWFSLHPCLLEGLFQTAVLGLAARHATSLSQPIYLQGLTLHQPLPTAANAQVVFTSPLSCSLTLSDQNGQVCLSIDNLVFPEPQENQTQLETEVSLPFHPYQPCWINAPIQVDRSFSGLKDVVVFTHEDPCFEAVRQELSQVERQPNDHLIWVKPGKMFRQIAEDSYQIKTDSEASFRRLFEAFTDRNIEPSHILYLWPAHHRETPDATQPNWSDALSQSLDVGLRGLFHLQQSILALKSKKTVHFVTAYRPQERHGQPHHQAMASYARTTSAEHPLFQHTLLCDDRPNCDQSELARAALRECVSATPEPRIIRIDESRRQQQVVKPASTELVSEPVVGLREKGVYLITGGHGGLGFILAKHMAEKSKACILLTGRSKFTKAIRKKMKAIKNAGGDAQYLQADVTDREAMQAAIVKCVSHFGSLNGVLHCAGVLGDKLFFNLTSEEIDQVLHPKMWGAMVLDEVTAAIPLDFFMLFSSVSAMTANEGQAAYAAANGFLDGFAVWRNSKLEEGGRWGRTLSVNWPLWQDGGMVVDAETQAGQAQLSGMTPMTTPAGIAAFDWVLEQGLSQSMPLTGDLAKIDALFGLEPRVPKPTLATVTTPAEPLQVDPITTAPSVQVEPSQLKSEQVPSQTVSIKPELLADSAREFFRQTIASALQADLETIDAQAPFTDYGVDSFLTLKIIRQLEKIFGRLPKTLMFENFNIEDLVTYFTEKHQQPLIDTLGLAPKVAPSASALPPAQVHTPTASAPIDAMAAKPPHQEEPAVVIDATELKAATTRFLKVALGKALQADPDGIDPAEPFSDYGVDSFLTLKIIRNLEKDFGRLPKTLMFENFNINDLVAYFNQNHSETLLKKLDLVQQVQATTPKPMPAPPQPNQPKTPVAAAKPVVQPRHQAIMVRESQLAHHTELQAISQACFQKYGFEAAALARRDIAPFLFFGSQRRGYFYTNHRDGLLLAFSYVGPSDYFGELVGDLLHYCQANDFQMNILHQTRLQGSGNVAFTATPFGANQRVPELKNFTLRGNRMRRLRYLIGKYKHLGTCETCEYQSGSDSETDQAIVAMIDRWCDIKTMVNPYIENVKAEIAAGKLGHPYRIFLTHLNGELQNVIVITKMPSPNGYLMDCEFYGDEMPLGGLEFTISRILETLRDEACESFSLGATFGVQLAPSPNADPDVVETLTSLREQGLFNGEGNLQFKNKFRTVNAQLYLIRPVGADPDTVTDIIMMIASPANMEAHTAEEPAPSTSADTSHEAREQRVALLDAHGHNPNLLSADQVSFEMFTDSWAQLHIAAVHNRIDQLQARLKDPLNLEGCLRKIFPFEHITSFASGRLAESIFMRAWPLKDRQVVQNLLFPTWISHEINADLEPIEMPTPAVFELETDERFKGNLDIDRLRKHLTANPGKVAFICVEVGNNAAGGQPVSLAHLKEVRALSNKHGVALVLDATRIVENAYFIGQHETAYAKWDVWDIIGELCAQADHLTASLCKDFGTNIGGIVATRDPVLHRCVQDAVSADDGALSFLDKMLIAHAVHDQIYIKNQVRTRMDATEKLYQGLLAVGVPIAKPVGGHCVLIDIKRISELSQHQYPLQSFLAWLYRETGCRAGIHNAGMQKGSGLNDTIRLAVPLGSTLAMVEALIPKMTAMFSQKVDIPNLAMVRKGPGLFGEVKAIFAPLGKETPAPPVETTGAEAPTVSKPHGKPEDIAIIGVSGRYPMADSLTEFWDNLVQGRDCIIEAPLTIKGERVSRKGRPAINTGWGGYINDVGKFDARFFNITPRDAERHDPQERLFLQAAWEVIENAGYHPDNLVPETADRNVGVFVGGVWTLYQVIGADQVAHGNLVAPNSYLWAVANRVSAFMDLRGPSIAVDTACSSSMTALHLACESLRKGDCQVAIAGGVNLELHAMKFLISQAASMLAKDGKCRSFGKRASGYVPGEGIGALLLKPLSQAIADGDHIKGLIKATTLNHGGRAAGFTVPNPVSQGKLIAKAMNDFGVDPGTVSYIEAHGTGTDLGDPIEIVGLTNAFRTKTQRQQFCAIGSVKSNIGHLEAAAGIAGITKVLLQMKHQQLVPSLHSKELNPHIDFSATPFFVQQDLTPWTPKDEHGKPIPMRAGVSSFGAGGVNAHVILESYPQLPSQTPDRTDIYVFSARNDARLREMVTRFLDFLNRENDPDNRAALTDMAFTLRAGRKAMDCRLALLANDRKSLKIRLQSFLDGQTNSEHIFTATLKKGQLADGPTGTARRQARAAGKKALVEVQLSKIAEAWITGLIQDWEPLHQTLSGHRTPLPTYPFEKEHHWMPELDIATPLASGAHQLHPLITRNASTLTAQKFVTELHGHQFFLSDHVVGTQKILPGVAYLEMARAAGALAGETNVRKIQKLVWSRPIILEQSGTTEKPCEVTISLTPEGDLIQFEIATEGPKGAPLLHSKGHLIFADPNQAQDKPEAFNIEAIWARCTQVKDRETCYKIFKSSDLHYGPAFKPIQELRSNPREAISRLELPEKVSGGFDQFLLHPSLMDGALQTVTGLMTDEELASNDLYVPFTLGEIEIFQPLTETVYSYLKPSSQQQGQGKVFDVWVLNEAGEICLRLKDYFIRILPPVGQTTPTETIYYRKVWNSTPLEEVATPELGTMLCFDQDSGRVDRIRKATASAKVIQVSYGETFAATPDRITLQPQRLEDWEQLFAYLEEKGQMPTHAIHAWCLDGAKEASSLVKTLELGAYSLFYLTQVLMNHKHKDGLRLLFLHGEDDLGALATHAGIFGLASTVRMENPKYVYTSLCLTAEASTADQLPIAKILAEFGEARELAVRLSDQDRWVKQPEEFDPSTVADQKPIAIEAGGVYLIAGGIGGLGLLFANDFAKQAPVKLALVGRSPLTKNRTEKIEALRQLGAEVSYFRGDIGKWEDTQRVVAEVRTKFGPIRGVIHSAGIIRDAFILKKTAEEMDAVLQPKIFGTVHLDEATAKEPLDFYVLFSSIAGVSGNVGQLDYAYGNSFMDAFATRRQQQVAKGLRQGRSLAMDWPLWRHGGMSLDAQGEALLEKTVGMRAMQTANGLAAFHRGLALGLSEILVVEGDGKKLRKHVAAKPKRTKTKASSNAALADVDQASLQGAAESFLKNILAEETKLPPEKIDAGEPLEDYGIDSIMILNLSDTMETHFGELSKTLLFEYQTIGELAEYFVEDHAEVLLNLVGDQMTSGGDTNSKSTTKVAARTAQKPAKPSYRIGQSVTTGASAIFQDEIAIVGLAGRYPQADDLDQFWDNLKHGRDAISEIPEDRWDWRAFFDENRDAKGKMYSRWGGFLKDVDKFDPFFFKISPREAEVLDPQERLFLETVWKTIEDAGYTRDQLGTTRVGVFVGVMWGHYQLFGTSESPRTESILGSASYASIANRISYIFNFQGPSLSVDTMCSSSLTSLHLACQSLRNGESDMAIAGGVNLTIHPDKYLLLSQGQFLASDGRCRSFGEGGDGYVPGEGVGALLLKPKSQALADGDHIYAIVKSSFVNHGGKTNGYSVPNPRAQGELIRSNIEASGLDPQSLTYLETHGTGTSLGDPIEMTGLTRAFKSAKLAKGSVAIGSVKSNIGHLEAAAGVAALTKVLLQMRHRKIVPSLHSETLNPNINFKDSPFVVQQQLGDWKPSAGAPLRAGISSFGAGGSNAHIILEAFEQEPGEGAAVESPQLIVLSARNADRLKAYAASLKQFLDRHLTPSEGSMDTGMVLKELHLQASRLLGLTTDAVAVDEALLDQGFDILSLNQLAKYIQTTWHITSNPTEFGADETLADLAQWLSPQITPSPNSAGISLRDLAYTLQVGREAMSERLAIAVTDLDDLATKLEQYLKGKKDIEGLHQANTKKATTDQLLEGEAGEAFLQVILENQQWAKLGLLWVGGYRPDWLDLHGEQLPNRISLPTYPFERQSFWIPLKQAAQVKQATIPTTLVTRYAKAVWQKSDHVPKETRLEGPVLVLDVQDDRVKALRQIAGPDQSIIWAEPGDDFKKIGEHHYRVQPQSADSVTELLKDLTDAGQEPRMIVHGLAMTFPAPSSQEIVPPDDLENRQGQALGSLFQLARAVVKLKLKKVKHLVYWIAETADPIIAAGAAFDRALGFSYPGIRFTTITDKGSDVSASASHLVAELAQAKAIPGEVRYTSQGRELKRFEILTPSSAASVIRTGGVYLITGGSGGLGFIFAQYLAKHYQAKLILTGRSPMKPEKQNQLDALQTLGGQAIYLSADVADLTQMRGVIADAKAEFDNLHGVIHAAGRMSETPIGEKDFDACLATFQPKISGTLVLDQATADLDLDFFVLFSSTASLLGDMGVFDYSISNRFQDVFAQKRNALEAQGLRKGHSLAINWPLWREGGMGMQDREAEAFYLKSAGLGYLEKEEGLQAFEMLLNSGEDQVMLMVGEPDRVDRFLGMQPEKTTVAAAPIEVTIAMNDDQPLDQAVHNQLKQITGAILKMDTARLDSDENLGDFGFDSVSLAELATTIGDAFDIDLPPTVFFSHNSINALTEYLLENHSEDISAVRKAAAQEKSASKPAEAVNQSMTTPAAPKPEPRAKVTPTRGHEDPIAIVGMAGRMPGSKDLADFWLHLVEGDHLISEIPKDRWDWQAIYGDPNSGGDRTNIKFGGFVADADKFDPEFFNISRAEAEVMDPQQRLCLMCVWHAIEDAGYRPSTFSGSPTGLFIGVAGSDYENMIHEYHVPFEAHMATGTSHAILVNRISYFLNLRGPSEPVDTACSSAFTALHRAMVAIRNGDCEQAIAGGVNLLLSPKPFIAGSKAGFFSPDGACKTFDKDANGYVRAEGVGMVLLKPLTKAIADGDQIYGVVRGSALNHGGRANSLTAPNPNAQAEVIRQATKRAGIDPTTLGYIETHGTGTPLGDPVEINGLKDAFRHLLPKDGKQPARRIGLGSVKANAGHLEIAAGMASLFKVLLAMRHKTLPAAVHLNEVNPYIDLSKTPFRLIRATEPWAPVLDEQGNPLPYRAGISSFGYGGANAHLILESYPREASAFVNENPGLQLLTISAKNPDRLKELAGRWLTKAQAAQTQSLAYLSADAAQTAQQGREAMTSRLAFAVRDTADLISKLERFLSEESAADIFYASQAATEVDNKPISIKNGLPTDEDGICQLAQAWVNHQPLDWSTLYTHPHQRVGLPLYPFARERHWIAQFSATEPRPRHGGLAPSPIMQFFAEDWSAKSLKQASTSPKSILIIGELTPLGEALHQAITRHGGTCFTVVYASEFAKKSATEFTVNRKSPADFEQLFEQLSQVKTPPETIYQLASQAGEKTWSAGPDSDILVHLFMSQALAKHPLGSEIQVMMVHGEASAELACLQQAQRAAQRTMAMETIDVIFKSVVIQTNLDDADTAKALLSESQASGSAMIRLGAEGRFVGKVSVRASKASTDAVTFRQGGRYIISGGAGGVGRLLARYLLTRYQAKCALFGRRPQPAEIKPLADAFPDQIAYFQTDITAESSLSRALGSVRKAFGGVDGIIHAAGGVDDSLHFTKSAASFSKVIAPKLTGTQLLDHLTREDALDWFICFGSTSSVFGNPGQVDYAYANGFLGGFAKWRNQQARAGLRNGQCLTVSWPLWAEGGMMVPEATWASIEAATGMAKMPNAAAFDALETAMANGWDHIAPLWGDMDKIRKFFAPDDTDKNVTAASSGDGSAFELSDLLPDRNQIAGIVAAVVKEPVAKILSDRPFSELGLDSLLNQMLLAKLGEHWTNLPSTLLFEYHTVNELTAGLAELVSAGRSQSRQRATSTTGTTKPASSHEKKPSSSYGNSVDARMPTSHDPIAIIGLSGRYPQAPNLDAFWENLRQGKDCVTEIPADRWDWREYYHADPARAAQGKIYCKWGSFIEDVDQFDPLFFKMMPRDAAALDPQERVFLQTAWSAFEDAGYTSKTLWQTGNGDQHGQVGVFAGVTTMTYPFLGMGIHPSGRLVLPNSLPWSLANRISYLLNLRGPSMPVDTACSSSLTAIHLACESLRRGECEMALAGGVNLYLHPIKYLGLCQLRMLSQTGQCSSFGAGSDGFIPGEGVGAVILKSLTAAERDGDQIYAVIRGSAINHGGHTNGYNVPNPNAQAALISTALKNANIDPETIGYIEAHGTGTSLGDPIELAGLSKAFANAGNRDRLCALGSAKSNIGHLEAAAGIAGLTKVLLQLKHREIAPTLHIDPVNPNLDLAHAPFRLQKELSPWQPIQDGEARALPRRAGISSFGAGGANAHLIIEEYMTQPVAKPVRTPQLIALSATQASQLREKAAQLLAWLPQKPASDKPNRDFTAIIGETIAHILSIPADEIDTNADLFELGLDPLGLSKLAAMLNTELDWSGDIFGLTDLHTLADMSWQIALDLGTTDDQHPDHHAPSLDVPSLQEVAYTLQVGRAAFQHRLAFVAKDLNDIAAHLRDFLADQPSSEICSGIASDHPSGETLDPGDLVKWAQAWVAGEALDFEALHQVNNGHGRPRKISLPTYPFSRNRYWLGDLPTQGYDLLTPSAGASKANPMPPSETRSLLHKRWHLAETPSEAIPLRGMIWLLANRDSFEFAKAFAAATEGNTTIFLNQVEATPETMTFEFADGQAGIDAATQALAKGAPNYLCDFSDWWQSPCDEVSPNFGKIMLVRDAVRKSGKLHLVHCTYGLQPWQMAANGTAGSRFAGLVRMLSAEYAGVHARTMDLDKPPVWNSNLNRLIQAELHSDDPHTEVIYRDHRRSIPKLEIAEQLTANQQVPVPSLNPAKCYVVTGGTRGLGSEIASHFAELGARKLALFGHKPLPPRPQWSDTAKQTDHPDAVKIQKLLALEAKGVQVRVHCGSLSDHAALASFFETLREELGPIAGLVHCAGLVSSNSPAFIKKSAADFQAICEPKIEGLNTLIQLTETDALEFFVMFSSVSAVIPSLAVAGSDYASANAYMDYVAQIKHAQGATPYLSLQWPSWEEAGMGKVTAGAYQRTGLGYLKTENGLALLDWAISHPVTANRIPIHLPTAQMPALENLLHARPAVVTPVKTVDRAMTTASHQNVAALLAGLRQRFAKELELPEDQLPNDKSFAELGIDSVLLTELGSQIEAWLGMPIDPSLPLEYPTLNELANHLATLPGLQLQPTKVVQEPLASSDQDASHSFAILAKVRTLFAAELEIAPDQLDENRHFADLGIDSVLLTDLLTRIEKQFELTLDPSILLEHPNLKALSNHLTGMVPTQANTVTQKPAVPQEPITQPIITSASPARARVDRRIAVIGAGCHFPKAPNLETYWQNLANSVDCISEIPADRWDMDRYYSAAGESGKSISKWGGFLADITRFDPEYFKIRTEEAPYLDPLIRQVLEVSVETLCDAGYQRTDLSNQKVGVYMGARMSNYSARFKHFNKHTVTGLGQNFIAAHVSHLLNLKGPNLVVDSACSSSLLSIHLACQDIFLGSADTALVGGVDLLLDEMPYLVLSQGKALSPQGRCHTFDQKADGFVPGEGCGMVLLKSLERALIDGDRIYAVIEATAINNDGQTMGITTPNPEAQKDVIRTALHKSGLSAEDITYIEAHGTGTMIGDPIELKGLTSVFGESTQRQGYCAVGSVKSNMGHLLSAAGIASFIKVILAIQNRSLPPTLNCDTPNPRFNFAASPFFPNTRLTPWQLRAGQLRHAGISAFGFGGTNAHIIVGELPPELGHKPSRKPLAHPQFNRRRFWIDKAETTEQRSAPPNVPVVQIGWKSSMPPVSDPDQEPNPDQRLELDFV